MMEGKNVPSLWRHYKSLKKKKKFKLLKVEMSTKNEYKTDTKFDNMP